MRYPPGTVALAACLLAAAGCAPSSVSLGDIRSESEWVDFHSSSVARCGRFTLEQKYSEPTGGVRTVYIQRDDDAAPRVIYKHERGIRALVGHTGRYVLINDYFATKVCNVVVVDLETGRNWRIDIAAREDHTQSASEEWTGVYFIPRAKAFSPDDSRVRISLSQDILPRRDAVPYPVWSYVVETRSGAVLHEYLTDGRVPRLWWEFEETSPVDKSREK